MTAARRVEDTSGQGAQRLWPSVSWWSGVCMGHFPARQVLTSNRMPDARRSTGSRIGTTTLGMCKQGLLGSVEVVCPVALLVINVTTTTTTMSCTVAPNLVPPVSCICLKLQHESARIARPRRAPARIRQIARVARRQNLTNCARSAPPGKGNFSLRNAS